MSRKADKCKPLGAIRLSSPLTPVQLAHDLGAGETCLQSDNISHVDAGDDLIDTVISNIIIQYPTLISRMTTSTISISLYLKTHIPYRYSFDVRTLISITDHIFPLCMSRVSVHRLVAEVDDAASTGTPHGSWQMTWPF